MPTGSSEPASYSGIRSRWLVRTHAGRPDSPGRMFGRPPARLLTPVRSPKSPKPECASEPPSGLADSVGLHFGVVAEKGDLGAIGVPAGNESLALLVRPQATITGATTADAT